MKCSCPDAGLLSVRLGLAAVFITHGAMKMANITGTMAMFGKMGMPAWLGVLVGAIEILGGVSMLLGVYVKYAGYALAAVMAGAILIIKWKSGFAGGWEFEFLLLAASLGMAWTGAGKYAVNMPEKLPWKK